jgi:uncharacterized protein
MLLIQTSIAESRIHGIGLFAAETIIAGQVFWRLDLTFDRAFTNAEFENFPAITQAFIQHHGWKTDTGYILPMDNDRFMNHADDPNQIDGVAQRMIEVGDEITSDYIRLENKRR